MLRQLLHTKSIKVDCCPIKYPWGWRCQTVIGNIMNQPKKRYIRDIFATFK